MMYLDGKIKKGILIEPYGNGDYKEWFMSCVENDEVKVIGRLGNTKDDEPKHLVKMIKLHIERLIKLNNNKGGQ